MQEAWKRVKQVQFLVVSDCPPDLALPLLSSTCWSGGIWGFGRFALPPPKLGSHKKQELSAYQDWKQGPKVEAGESCRESEFTGWLSKLASPSPSTT